MAFIDLAIAGSVVTGTLQRDELISMLYLEEWRGKDWLWTIHTPTLHGCDVISPFTVM